VFASVTGHPPISPGTGYFFIALALILVYGTAVGLLTSALNVYLRDVQYLVEVLLLLLMWASPIVYSWNNVKHIIGDGVLLNIYTDSPITLSVLGFQRALWTSGGTNYSPGDLLTRMLVALVVGVVLLFLTQRVFAKLQGNFAQEL